MNSFPMARVAPEKADFRPALPLGFLPGVNGTHMGKMTYGEQLKHPNWQRKRLVDFGRAVAVMPLDGGPWAFNEFVAVACGWAEDDLEDGEALNLAGGEGYLQSFHVGKMAREMVWEGPRGWPIETIMTLCAVTPDAEFLSGLAALCAEARKRSEARREASGL